MSTHRQLPNNTDIAPWQKKGRWYHIFFESTSEGFTISQENSDADILSIIRSLSGAFPIVMDNSNFRICDYKTASKHTDFVITSNDTNYSLSMGYPISNAKIISTNLKNLTNKILADTYTAIVLPGIPSPFYLRDSGHRRFYYQTPIFIQNNKLTYYDLLIYTYSSLTKFIGTITDGTLTWVNEDDTVDYQVVNYALSVPPAYDVQLFDSCDLWLFGYFE